MLGTFCVLHVAPRSAQGGPILRVHFDEQETTIQAILSSNRSTKVLFNKNIEYFNHRIDQPSGELSIIGDETCWLVKAAKSKGDYTAPPDQRQN